jgi:hypothetical protein
MRSHEVDTDARSCVDRLPHPDRLRLALRLERLGLAVVDHVVGRPVGRLADKDPVHRRCRLQSRGRVDDVTRRHPLTFGGARAERDERLAGVDGDPHLELVLLVRPVADRKRGADGAFRVVLVRGRRAEERHHRVADELLDGAAEPLELTAQVCVVRPEKRADVLGIELLGPGGEADQVREEDGHDLALLARSRCGRIEGGAA